MRRLLGALLLVCLPTMGHAATLYVNNSGSPTCSDATAKASNSAGTPWCTIYRAAKGVAPGGSPSASEAASAGDTVLVTAGTYSIAGTGLKYEPAYNPVNSGTAGNLVTFQGVGTVTLTLSSSTGAVIGAYQKNYITWKNFTINEANAPSQADTGSVVLWESTGSTVENLSLNGNGDPGYGDNHPGVRIENSVSITVKNNIIRNYLTSVVNRVNGAGVQVYNSKGLTIEHNEIYDCGSGVFLKAIGFIGSTPTPGEYSDMQDVVRYNLIHDTAYGLVHHRHWHTASTVYVLWYQNIIRDVTMGGITLWGFVGDGPSNGRFVNNTVDGAVYGVYLKAEALTDTWNNLLQNNLITASTTYAILNDGTGGTSSYELDRATFERNWYWTFGTFENSGSDHTFATFQSAFTGQEANGTSGTDPSYVNQSGNNFHLSGGSAVLTAGRVVHSIGGSDGATIPVGAYITGSETIGVESGSTTPTRFDPTINLRRAEIDLLRDEFLVFRDEQAGRWQRMCTVLNRTRTTWAAQMRREIPC